MRVLQQIIIIRDHLKFKNYRFHLYLQMIAFLREYFVACIWLITPSKVSYVSLHKIKKKMTVVWKALGFHLINNALRYLNIASLQMNKWQLKVGLWKVTELGPLRVRPRVLQCLFSILKQLSCRTKVFLCKYI